MRIIYYLIFSILLSFKVLCNDSAYYGSGNHLIPIIETDVSVKKEILLVKKVGKSHFEVSVYYEFFNPGKEKAFKVGFEATSPFGDVTIEPINGGHPYIKDFSIDFNGEKLNYEVAIITDSIGILNGKINKTNLKSLIDPESGEFVGFSYIYHFDARFKRGINIVKHTYSFDISTSVYDFYSFQYDLTPAKRWANKQIDDFTLILDFGDFETFQISPTFFNSHSEWTNLGISRSKDKLVYSYDSSLTKVSEFHIQSGKLIFKKKNFKPKGDLYVQSSRNYILKDGAPRFSIPFSYLNDISIPDPENELEKKAYRNLPYARRGYIFKNKSMRLFFNKFDWYIPNPKFKPEQAVLYDSEKEWIDKWK
jgi:hypothetical protein